MTEVFLAGAIYMFLGVTVSTVMVVRHRDKFGHAANLAISSLWVGGTAMAVALLAVALGGKW